VLRRFFEVDAGHVVVSVLHGLGANGAVTAEVVARAIDRYGIDPGTPDPWSS
jgi:pyruvate dehydrogenase E1 component